jgi:hypothetical protein
LVSKILPTKRRYYPGRSLGLENRICFDAPLLTKPIEITIMSSSSSSSDYADKEEEKMIDHPMEVAKTREEYDQMSQEELIEYSRKYGEKITSCHKSDKNHRYPCGWCKKTPDETRIYVSPPNIWGQKDSRYLCYRCVTEEEQLRGWTELTETSYWLPIKPPAIPKIEAMAYDTPFELKKQLFQNQPLPPNRLDSRFQHLFDTVDDGDAEERRKRQKIED